MVQRRLGALVGALLACAGCCGDVSRTTWAGTLAYAFPSSARLDADGGTGGGGGTVAGSATTTVALDAFSPWVTNGFDGSYCGGGTFTVTLGPSCVLTARVGTTDYGGSKRSSQTASGSIDASQSCTLTTSQGTFEVTVQGGSVSISGQEVNLLVDTPNANLEFIGSLQ